MSAKPTGRLGRGLGDLIRKTDNDPFEGEPDGSHYAELPIKSIRPNARQPRQIFDEDALDELVASISEVGVLQPVVVRERERGHYELVMGERRWRASQQAGLTTIPAIVRGTEDDDLLRDALMENLHRADLNPLEEAGAYQQLLEDFGCTQGELAKRIKRSRAQIANTIRLLKLPAGVQLKVAAGVLSAGHARALLALEDADAQVALANRIIAEGLSVRTTEELVALREGNGPKVRRAPKPPSARALELSNTLSEHFETRVKVSLGKSRGRITIEFAGDQDLARILAIVNGKTIDP